MDLGFFRFLCLAETRRLVSLLGIIVALILVLQFSELPNSKFFSSLTARIKSFTLDTPLVNSTIDDNNVKLNASNSNSTNPLRNIAIGPQASSLDQVTNSEKSKELETVVGKDVNLTSQGIQSSLLAPQPMVPLSNGTFFDSKMYPKDGILEALQANYNATKGNDKPTISKNSKKKPLKVVTISEMNLMLQGSHASSQLLVCTGLCAICYNV
jgi:hypothetical protein